MHSWCGVKLKEGFACRPSLKAGSSPPAYRRHLRTLQLCVFLAIHDAGNARARVQGARRNLGSFGWVFCGGCISGPITEGSGWEVGDHRAPPPAFAVFLRCPVFAVGLWPPSTNASLEHHAVYRAPVGLSADRVCMVTFVGSNLGAVLNISPLKAFACHGFRGRVYSLFSTLFGAWLRCHSSLQGLRTPGSVCLVCVYVLFCGFCRASSGSREGFDPQTGSLGG